MSVSDDRRLLLTLRDQCSASTEDGLANIGKVTAKYHIKNVAFDSTTCVKSTAHTGPNPAHVWRARENSFFLAPYGVVVGQEKSACTRPLDQPSSFCALHFAVVAGH
jgi:hypothetical protein